MKNNNLLKRIGCIALAIVMIGLSVLSCDMSLKMGQAASTAWTKVDGVFVNSLGNEIKGATLKGIDVSYHNGDIDWEEVKESDIDYAIIRCGFGMDSKKQDDVKWEEYANACIELDIPFGTYLYSYATTVSAAKSEAKHVLRVIEGYPLTYPVYYDMEDDKQKGTEPKRKAQMAKAFCSIIEEAGYQVGIYANKDWFTNELTDSYFDSCDKWVAQYNSVCKYTGNYRMWQCTKDGKVPGISTKADLNFWYDQPPVYQGNTPEANTGTIGNPSGTQPGDNQTLENNSSSGENQITENNPANGNNQGTEINSGSENTPNSGSNANAENNTNQGTEINAGENPSTGNTPGSIDNSNSENSGNSENSDPSGNTQNQGNDDSSTKNPDIQGNDASGNQQGTETNENSGNTANQGNNSNNADKNEIDNQPAKLTISQNTLVLSYGGTSVLTASQSVKWASSDKEVVTIGSKGKVTPVGVGKAIITAKTSSGETAECEVTIKKPIKDTDIEAIPSQQFTGAQICPEPIIMDEDKTLEKGTDYKVSYMDNMGKGTAIITIKGKGYYTGSVDVNFQIISKEKLAVPVISSVSSKKSVVTLKWKKISKASGYEIYRATTKKGIYTLQGTLKKSKVTYKDKKLIKGKKYYYKIRAYKITDNKTQYSTYVKVNIKA